MKLIDVWINCPDAEVATRIADDLIGSRHAACANILGEIQSVYRWQGKVEREPEVPLVVKTRAELFDELAHRVAELHPYDTPGIIALPIERLNAAYGKWLIEQTHDP
ncbi:MAG: divalent-cation tolerance protein CutA [Woeseiaceae bacterium]|nr:divalent-cation tolerance protein CutA [Woeseiaceae bacterium]